MAKLEKLLKKIKNNPTNTRFETIQKLLLHFGFEERQPSGGSSHFTYYKEGYHEIITIPRNKPIKKVYVKRVTRIIEQILQERE